MLKLKNLLLGSLLVLACAGCGTSGPTLCEVEGVVTLDDKPVPDAELTFIPQNVPTTMVSYGRTDDNGRYKLAFTATKTGAIPATHHVRIEPPKGTKLPRKYKDDQTITAEVKKGRNVVDLRLTQK